MREEYLKRIFEMLNSLAVDDVKIIYNIIYHKYIKVVKSEGN